MTMAFRGKVLQAEQVRRAFQAAEDLAALREAAVQLAAAREAVGAVVRAVEAVGVGREVRHRELLHCGARSA